MITRNSPQLSRLPRRELGKVAVQRVKLRQTWHRRAKDPIPQRFVQLTVPVDIADQLPEDAVFEVTFSGSELRYRLVEPVAPSAPTRPSDPAGGETARFTTEGPS